MSLKPISIVIHCSASTWGDAAEIDKWHKENGWAGIGYHAVILNGRRKYGSKYEPAINGKIEPGRPEDVVGAHCLAQGMNNISLGVCLVGTPGFYPFDHSQNIEQATADFVIRPYPTKAQQDALVYWLAVNCKQYGIDPMAQIKNPYNGKTIFTISQHSDHDPVNKPFCASLKLDKVRQLTAQQIRKI